MAVSTLTCPLCNHKQRMHIPEKVCQAFYVCDKCKIIIQAKTCCVFCDYGDVPCPVNQKN